MAFLLAREPPACMPRACAWGAGHTRQAYQARGKCRSLASMSSRWHVTHVCVHLGMSETHTEGRQGIPCRAIWEVLLAGGIWLQAHMKGSHRRQGHVGGIACHMNTRGSAESK
eukprot:scaffold63650_cov19-Tisochrysis_lutea.AAC.2